jgi:hypothetical protein
MQCDLRNRDGRIKAALCAEKQRLMEELLKTIRDLLFTQEQQLKAVVTKDPDFARFDILLEMANVRKRAAKYAYLKHVETHEC